MADQAAEKQPVMSWAEVRAMSENGVPIALLSVPDARLRHVSPDHLLPRHKEMPPILTAFVLKGFNHGLVTEDFEAFLAPRETAEEALQQMASLEIVCKQGFAYPKIVDELQAEGEITIDDVSPFDRGLAFRLMFLPREVLRTIKLDGVMEAIAEPVAEMEPS